MNAPVLWKDLVSACFFILLLILVFGAVSLIFRHKAQINEKDIEDFWTKTIGTLVLFFRSVKTKAWKLQNQADKN